MSRRFFNTLPVQIVFVLALPHVANAATWNGLGGSISPADPLRSGIAVIRHDGALWAFARGTDNALWTISQTSPDGPWGPWRSLGGFLKSNPAVAEEGSGFLKVFVRGGDDLIWELEQVTPGTFMTGWERLPIPLTSSGQAQSLTGDPAVTVDAVGRIHVFAISGDQALWTTAETSIFTGGPWRSWMSLGGVVNGSPSAITNTNGSLEVFVTSAVDATVWHNWTVDSNFDWNGWALLATAVSTGNPVPLYHPIAVVDPGSGWAGVFGRGPGSALWYTLHPPGQGWFQFNSLGGYLTSDPSVAFGSDGSINAFVNGGDNALWFITAQPSPFVFGSWASLSGVLANGPAAALNQDGRMAVFVEGTDTTMWTIEQTSPGSWQ